MGDIEHSKPNILIKKVVNKDNHRHLRTEDIIGASPKILHIKRVDEADDEEKRHLSHRIVE